MAIRENEGLMMVVLFTSVLKVLTLSRNVTVFSNVLQRHISATVFFSTTCVFRKSDKISGEKRQNRDKYGKVPLRAPMV